MGNRSATTPYTAIDNTLNFSVFTMYTSLKVDYRILLNFNATRKVYNSPVEVINLQQVRLALLPARKLHQ